MNQEGHSSTLDKLLKEAQQWTQKYKNNKEPGLDDFNSDQESILSFSNDDFQTETNFSPNESLYQDNTHQRELQDKIHQKETQIIQNKKIIDSHKIDIEFFKSRCGELELQLRSFHEASQKIIKDKDNNVFLDNMMKEQQQEISQWRQKFQELERKQNDSLQKMSTLNYEKDSKLSEKEKIIQTQKLKLKDLQYQLSSQTHKTIDSLPQNQQNQLQELKLQNTQLKDQKDVLNQKLTSFQDNQHQLNYQILEQDKLVQSLQLRVNQVQSDLTKKNTLHNKIFHLLQQHDIISDPDIQFIEFEKQLNNFLHMYKRNAEQATQSHFQANAYQNKIKDLESSFSQKHQEINELQKQCQAHKVAVQQHEKTQQENEKLKGQISSHLKQHSELQEQVQKSLSQISQYEQQLLNQQKSDIVALETDTLSQFTMLSQEIQEKQDIIQKHEIKLQKIGHENEISKQQIRDKSEVISQQVKQIDSLRKEILDSNLQKQIAQQNLSSLQEKNKYLKEQNDEHLHLVKEHGQYQNMMKQMEGEILLKEKVVSNLQDTSEQLKLQVQDLKKKLNQKQGEIDRNQLNSQENQFSSQKLQNLLLEKEEQIQVLKKEISSIQEQKYDIQNKTNTLIDQNTVLQKKQQKIIENYQSELDALKQKAFSIEDSNQSQVFKRHQLIDDEYSFNQDHQEQMLSPLEQKFNISFRSKPQSPSKNFSNFNATKSPLNQSHTNQQDQKFSHLKQENMALKKEIHKLQNGVFSSRNDKILKNQEDILNYSRTQDELKSTVQELNQKKETFNQLQQAHNQAQQELTALKQTLAQQQQIAQSQIQNSSIQNQQNQQEKNLIIGRLQQLEAQNNNQIKEINDLKIKNSSLIKEKQMMLQKDKQLQALEYRVEQLEDYIQQLEHQLQIKNQDYYNQPMTPTLGRSMVSSPQGGHSPFKSIF